MGLCFRSVEAEITKGKGEDPAEASSLLPLLLRGAEDETRMKTCPPPSPPVIPTQVIWQEMGRNACEQGLILK